MFFCLIDLKKNSKIKNFKYKNNQLSKRNLVSILKQLKKFILKLNDYKSVTTWDTYSVENSYTSNADQAKKEIVKNFFNKNNFNLACDLGCNDGIYSEIALRNKCQRVVGFDFDINSVDKAYWRSKKNN